MAMARVMQGRRAATSFWGSREVRKQTYSLLDFTSGGSLARPKCLNLLGKSKEKHNVIQCLQKEIIISQWGLKFPAGPCVGLAAS